LRVRQLEKEDEEIEEGDIIQEGADAEEA